MTFSPVALFRADFGSYSELRNTSRRERAETAFSANRAGIEYESIQPFMIWYESMLLLNASVSRNPGF